MTENALGEAAAFGNVARMTRFIVFGILGASLAAGVSGCVSQPGSRALERGKEPVAAAEAPLGSRIKKRSSIAPVQGATRNDVEQARVQAGAAQTGAFNRTGN